MPYLLNRKLPLTSRPLLFIDLEMTGLDASRHEIVEIAALKVRQTDLEIENSFYTKVFPEHIETADPRSLKVIDYSKRSWLGAIPLKQALTELSAFAPDCILAGWAVQNEWDFLLAGLHKEQLPIFFHFYLLEVWAVAYTFYRQEDPQKLDLETVSRRLGIGIERHSPDSDIRATLEIYRHLTKNPA